MVMRELGNDTSDPFGTKMRLGQGATSLTLFNVALEGAMRGSRGSKHDSHNLTKGIAQILGFTHSLIE